MDAHGNTKEEVAIVGSTDGHVYMIPYETCIRNGDNPCVEKWSTDVGAPVYAAIRATSSGLLPSDNLGEGIVFVGSSTIYNTDAGGVLHALNASDGKILWSKAAVDGGGTNYSMRHPPAIDANRRALVNAYGPVLQLLDLTTGTEIARLDPSQTSAQDEFYSAPVLTLDSDRIYIQSKKSYLWAIDIKGERNGTESTISLQVAYRCRYESGAAGAVAANCTWPGNWTAEQQPTLELPKGKEGLTTISGSNRFSTPALNINDTIVTLSTFKFNSAGALVQVDAATGNVRWSYTGREPGALGPQFGNSRSSPALDEDGNVFVGSDAVDGPYEIPTLWAFGPHGAYKWSVRLAEDDVVLGPISPVVANGNVTRGRVYMASFVDIYAFEKGCPTAANGLPCNGTGVCLCKNDLAEPVCDCGEKTCANGPACDAPEVCVIGTCKPGRGCVCNGCFTDPECKVPLDCGDHGKCNADLGECECDNCYTGRVCDAQNTCSGKGTCNVNTGACSCSNCYTGDKC